MAKMKFIVEGTPVGSTTQKKSSTASKPKSKAKAGPGRKKDGKTIGSKYFPLVVVAGYNGKKQPNTRWPGKGNKVYSFNCPKCKSPKGHKCASASGPVRPHKERWAKAYGKNYTA